MTFKRRSKGKPPGFGLFMEFVHGNKIKHKSFREYLFLRVVLKRRSVRWRGTDEVFVQFVELSLATPVATTCNCSFVFVHHSLYVIIRCRCYTSDLHHLLHAPSWLMLVYDWLLWVRWRRGGRSYASSQMQKQHDKIFIWPEPANRHLPRWQESANQRMQHRKLETDWTKWSERKREIWIWRGGKKGKWMRCRGGK